MTEVISYTSALHKGCIKVVLYRKGKKYGVVTIRGNAAISRDYQNIGEDLSTFIGHEAEIIDWTSLDKAKTRYADLLSLYIQQDLGMPNMTTTLAPRGKSILRLINGAGGAQ